MEQRIPPQNVEAEQAVLGAMLLSHDAVIVAMEKLQPRDFYRDAHRIIFEAMEHLHRENKEIDVITLPEELNRMKKTGRRRRSRLCPESAQYGRDGVERRILCQYRRREGPVPESHFYLYRAGDRSL
mgnify:CR=1 FL=1